MPTREVDVDGYVLTLDARPDRLDLRDLPYRPPIACLPPRHPSDDQVKKDLPAYLDAGLILDQGKEGACTGFGLAATINYLLWIRSGTTMRSQERVSPRMLYRLARFYDEWPGENYEGSSCRGALKGWYKHGVCSETLWPSQPEAPEEPKENWDSDAVTRPLGIYYRIERQSVVELQAAIHQSGAIYVSANVHAGWKVKSQKASASHTDLPVIKPGGKALGGHAFALVGYNELGFIVQNSWGKNWGASGFAVLTYEDWVANGSDAWVVGLGVPVQHRLQGKLKGQQLKSPKHFIQAHQPAGPRASLPGWLGGDDPLADLSDIWSLGEAYPHTLVAGNDGTIINRLVEMPDAQAAAQYVCRRRPREFFASRPEVPARIVIYAHGGLNDEAESISRIRVMGPYFKDNDIYPVFVTWKSGWAETLADMLADASQKELGATTPARSIGQALNEAWDRTIEVLARGLVVRGMWSEMKENVEAGEGDGHDLSVLATHLADLDSDLNGKLEIHIVGHSAGSFVCGRLLTMLRDLNQRRGSKVTVRSCTLYAPACDLDFALDHYKAAIDARLLEQDALRIHALSDARELEDTVGPYTKSLLYLVSRALERRHKTPLMGLASSFDGARTSGEFWNENTLSSVQAWQAFFWRGEVPAGFAQNGKLASKSLLLLNDNQVDTGPCEIKSAHGCFDNAIDILDKTLRAILRIDASAKLTRPVKNLHF